MEAFWNLGADVLGAGGLPEPLPADPMPLFRAWFDEAAASKKYADPNAMTLATCTREGFPSARIVLCKGIEDGPAPAIRFFTNYDSRKGQELRENPRAAVVFHWPHAERQVRMEGAISVLEAEASDAYFNSRGLSSRLGAWASDQSRPLPNRGELLKRVASAAAKFGVAGAVQKDAIPRPVWWGGFRITIQRLELWCGAGGRLHDRAAWVRGGNGWEGGRLFP